MNVLTRLHSIEANKFMTKEGVPGMADGAIDGVIDTEFNKYK